MALHQKTPLLGIIHLCPLQVHSLCWLVYTLSHSVPFCHNCGIRQFLLDTKQLDEVAIFHICDTLYVLLQSVAFRFPCVWPFSLNCFAFGGFPLFLCIASIATLLAALNSPLKSVCCRFTSSDCLAIVIAFVRVSSLLTLCWRGAYSLGDKAKHICTL